MTAMTYAITVHFRKHLLQIMGQKKIKGRASLNHFLPEINKTHVHCISNLIIKCIYFIITWYFPWWSCSYSFSNLYLASQAISTEKLF